ncbi:MAG: AIR synthase related protein [Desulfurococcales archaeon]|nr:AIR synthase related protein [Desulfurococcales archaeon]
MLEQEVFKLIQARLYSSDCYLYEACPLGRVVVNLDGYSLPESRYRFLTLPIWAWRAVMGAIMDVVATGARPAGVSVSLGLPEDEVYEALTGALEAARYAGATPMKHDTNTSREGWIDVLAVGELETSPVPRLPLRRRGELIVVQIGYAGYGAVEYRLHSSGAGVEAVPPWLVKRKPPIEAWRAISRCQPAAASDNSDGLGYTIKVMARLGKLNITLDRHPLVDPKLTTQYNLTPSEALTSWEDYNLILLTDKAGLECLSEEIERTRTPWSVIGSASPGTGLVTIGGRALKLVGWERVKRG